MHLYIVVDCKTKNCATAHVLLYLGEQGKVPGRVDYWMSYPLLIDCPICRTAYDYCDSEAMFRQKELPLPPPDGYTDRLAGPNDLNGPSSQES